MEIINIVVNSDDIDYYYKLADLCISPSIAEERFGLTVLECMAYGKPVVVSDIFAETGVADGSRAIIFPRGDVEKLTQILEEFVENPTKFDYLINRGIEYASKNNWDRVADRFEEFIKELLSK